MKEPHGLSLMELIIAVCILGSVLFAMSTLHLSVTGSKVAQDQGARMQNELLAIFRDFELQLQGGVRKGFLSHYPDGTEIPTDSPVQGPFYYRSEDKQGEIWMGTLVGSGTGAKEVWYGYLLASGVPPEAKLVRRVYTVGAAEAAGRLWTETELSTPGMFAPYADADLDNDGTVTVAGMDNEESLRDACVTAAELPKNLCEDKGVYPVFKTDPGKKTVSVSLSARGSVGTALGAKKDLKTAGITKTVFLHAELE